MRFYTELVQELTKSAIENKVIKFDTYEYDKDDQIAERNAFNTKQLTDFIATLSRTLNSLAGE